MTEIKKPNPSPQDRMMAEVVQGEVAAEHKRGGGAMRRALIHVELLDRLAHPLRVLDPPHVTHRSSHEEEHLLRASLARKRHAMHRQLELLRASDGRVDGHHHILALDVAIKAKRFRAALARVGIVAVVGALPRPFEPIFEAKVAL